MSGSSAEDSAPVEPISEETAKSIQKSKQVEAAIERVGLEPYSICFIVHSYPFLLWSGDGLQSLPPGHVLRRQLREDQPDLGTGTGTG